MLAVALEKKGNTNDLIPVYEQLLRLKPEDTSVREKLERAKATVGGK